MTNEPLTLVTCADGPLYPAHCIHPFSAMNSVDHSFTVPLPVLVVSRDGAGGVPCEESIPGQHRLRGRLTATTTRNDSQHTPALTQKGGAAAGTEKASGAEGTGNRETQQDNTHLTAEQTQ